MRAELDIAEAQRAVGETALLNLRILAGWLPRDGLELLRTLSAWFELANLEHRIGYLLGGPLARPFELGSLAVAWPAVAASQTSDELRAGLAPTRWSLGRDRSSGDLHLELRLAWARRVLRDVPEARLWAAGALALLAARELFVSGRVLAGFRDTIAVTLGDKWSRAGTLTAFRDALPPAAAWSLGGVESPEGLWRAEAAWWRRVEADGHALARSSSAGRGVVIGAVALLGADARRVAAALGCVARSGLPGAREAFDAIA
jgi:hypothetical protein